MNIQFTDYKRFFTSIGIALISLSVILPWLVLREPFEINVKASELAELTTLGQFNVLLRQFMALSLSLLSCCASPIFLIAGSFLLILGVPTWMIRETLEERREHKLKKLELKQIADKETYAEREKEQLIRDDLKYKTQQCFPDDNCQVSENKVIGNLSYDFIINFKDGISSDIMVKVKYAKTKKSFKLIELYLKSFIFALNKRQGEVNPSTRALGLIILAEKQPFSEQRGFRFFRRDPLYSLLSKYKRPDIMLHYLSERELNDQSPDEFLELFFPSGEYPWLAQVTSEAHLRAGSE